MKKFLLWCVLPLGVLVFLVFLGLQFFLGSVVKAAVNRYGPTITQTPVELADASLSPFSGAGTLRGLKVANPKGWSEDHPAFYLGSIHVDMKPFSVMGDHIVINEITIENPEFSYQTRLMASNIGDLLKNMDSTAGPAPGKTTPAQTVTTKQGKPIRFEVHKFVLRNGKITLGLGTNTTTLPMPEITLTDIGTNNGGVTPNEFAFAVMKSVTNSVASTAGKAALNIGKATGVKDKLEQTKDAFKGIFGGSK